MALTISGSSGISFGGSNYGLVQDQNGFITKPYQPAVWAFRTPGTNVWETFSTATVYIFNNVSTNRGGYYNNSTGIFTCPAAGYYRITCSFLCGQGGYLGYLHVQKNGANIDNSGNHVNTNGTSLWVTAHTTAIVNCAVNDTLNISILTSGGAAVYSEYSQLTIEFIG